MRYDDPWARPGEFRFNVLEGRVLARLKQKPALARWQRVIVNIIENMEAGIVYPPIDERPWRQRWKRRLRKALAS